jgi:hypothetical protein
LAAISMHRAVLDYRFPWVVSASRGTEIIVEGWR